MLWQRGGPGLGQAEADQSRLAWFLQSGASAHRRASALRGRREYHSTELFAWSNFFLCRIPFGDPCWVELAPMTPS